MNAFVFLPSPHIFSGQRNEEYSRILEQAAKEEDELRKAHMEELKASWARDAEQRRRNKAEEEGPSITSFIGHEDTGREERIRAQKEQLKRWLIEQANEHANRSMRDRQEDLAYADMLRAVAEVQEQAENEESMLRKELERRIGDENRRVRYNSYGRFE
jgi:small-conductance mechanosensitive channel